MNECTEKQPAKKKRHKMNARDLQGVLERAKGSGLLDQKVPKPARFALLEACGVPPTKAKIQAGYTENQSTTHIRKTGKYKQFKEALKEERARLSTKRGYRMADSAKFYKELSDNTQTKRLRARAEKALKEGNAELAAELFKQALDATVSDAARIRSRERLDKILGYESPIEVEQEQTREVSPAVALLQVFNEYNVTPAQMIQAAKGEPVKPVKGSRINATKPLPSPEDAKFDDLPLK